MGTQIPSTSPAWLVVAMTFEGMKEIKGPQTAPFISKMLQRLKSAWKDDETAWCGTFIAGVLDETNVRYGRGIAGKPGLLLWPKHWYRALAYADPQYGTHLSPKQYRPGAICAKTRKGGGHVFFYLGENATHIYGIGGNTSDSVKAAWYPKSEIQAVVWPQGSIMSNPDKDMRVMLQSNGTPVVERED